MTHSFHFWGLTKLSFELSRNAWLTHFTLVLHFYLFVVVDSWLTKSYLT